MLLPDVWPLAALFGAGLVAGALNIVAGGGSFLTLPLLLSLGLPAAAANGTNRVGLLTQSVAGVWGFHRASTLPWGWALRASLPIALGSVLGAWAALQLSDFAFKRLLAVAMLAMTLGTLLRPPRPGIGGTLLSPWHPGLVASLFAIGLYGGLIQAGVGFAILAAASVAGMDLVTGSAVKLVAVLALTVISLLVFAAGGAVWWSQGLVLGAGNFLGATLGVRLTVRLGHVWLQRVVTATVVAVAVALWLGA